MKIGLIASRVLIAILSVLMIFVVIGIPLSITFTAKDMPPSMDFFADMLVEFLPFAPFLLMPLLLVIAAENFIRYKLGRMDAKKFKMHVCFLAASGIILLVIIRLILVSISQEARIVMTEVS